MNAVMPGLFALTLFVAAGLLFSVEPMVARMVLPALGGSPSVWTTCVLFFQSALLAGYAYAHATAAWTGVRRQVVFHVAVLGAASLFLPISGPEAVSVDGLASGAGPVLAVLGWLARSAGLPFFAVAATAPLLQRWFAATAHPSARDPYFLYTASNAGSLAALIAYPLWVERGWSLGQQSAAWSVGFAVLAALLAVCGVVSVVHSRPPGDDEAARTETPAAPGAGWAWVVLAAIPSSLMLGVTTYLTTDLAAIPLLWVVPLALYLASFVVAFSRASAPIVRGAGRVFPWLVMVQAPVMAAGLVQPFWVPLHVATFFAAAVVCHGELARRRPPAARLTAFYLATAFGGALGGVFNALVAPVVFDRVAEYPLALVAACLVPGFRRDQAGSMGFGRRDLVLPAVVGLLTAALCANVGGIAGRGAGVVATMAASGLAALAAVGHRGRPVRFALTVGAVLLASSLEASVSGRVLLRERDFFGVLRVTETSGGRVHRLFHGSTLHGQQDLGPSRRREPSTYFDRSGPMGQVFAAFDARPESGRAAVAVTGMGAGALACYARPGQTWTFFEIDPAVVRIARDPRYFTYLSDCRAAALGVVIGDARLTLARSPDARFDLIVLDAFSSDAIPVHLLTREALALYRRKLTGDGMIVVNITNRYLELRPVVARLGRDAGMACRVRFDPVGKAEAVATGKQGALWAVLAGRDADLGSLATDPLWRPPEPGRTGSVWTDDFSNILEVIRLGPPRVGKRGP